MITCQHARQLFDRHLDGELSPSLQAELHAHQLSCSACQSELAMLEACGDVVALDRCEPALSDSFTDRVLLARRVQLARQPRRWGRAAIMVGSPMAAAASILLAITLIMPSNSQIRDTAVLGPGDGGAAKVAPALGKALSRSEDPTVEEKRELDAIPPMRTVGFVEKVLAWGMEQTQDTLDGAGRSVAELGLLWHKAFADANSQLAAKSGRNRAEDTVQDTPAERPALGPDLWAPPPLNSEPTGETPDELHLLDPI